ncbi:hypothetical protein J6590_084829 [Homalodisca vitripennis]|nr:hypothetical protein J6590_084829 [Homalodisca vitripennis]
MGLTEALGARSGQDVCILFAGCRCRGFHVELRAPRYVSFGNSALLKCDYSVPEDELHKVEWLHQNRKIWQYVKGRNPPFRNYSTTGSVIDRERERLASSAETNNGLSEFSVVDEVGTPLLTYFISVCSNFCYPAA